MVATPLSLACAITTASEISRAIAASASANVDWLKLVFRNWTRCPIAPVHWLAGLAEGAGMTAWVTKTWSITVPQAPANVELNASVVAAEPGWNEATRVEYDG